MSERYWKVSVKPSDDRALSVLLERARLERPGERVSASDVIRRAVHDACNGTCVCGREEEE